MNVAEFVFEQQADAADDEVQHDEFEQSPGDVLATGFGLDDEKYPLEQKRQVGGDQRDEQQDGGVEIHVWIGSG